MIENFKKVLFDWSFIVIGGGMILTPFGTIVSRNKEFLAQTDETANVKDEKLRKLVDEELRVILKRRRLFRTFEPKNVQVKVQNDVESSTGPVFFFLNDAIFCFSTRLALDNEDEDNNVEAIRRRYPNFFGLFKQNFGAQQERSVRRIWHNFRTALGFRDLAAIFEEKDLFHLSVDSSALSDDDVRTAFLSQNAKKFAIAREILSADRFALFDMCLYSAFTFSMGLLLFFFILKPKLHNHRLGVVISYSLSLLTFYLFERIGRFSAVLRNDAECMALGDAYVIGAKEYLQSSIRLGECLHRLTNGRARFDAVGDYTRHIVPYTTRLQAVEEEEKRRMKLSQRTQKEQQQLQSGAEEREKDG